MANDRCVSFDIHSIRLLFFFLGKEMTESWYNEYKKYDYRSRSYQPGTGHFTQVIWKGSQELVLHKPKELQ